MKQSITEEMRYRQRMCEYALRHGVTRAARRYQTNRMFVYRQLEKYDGKVTSLRLRSRKPHNSPNAHTEEELKLIKKWTGFSGRYGLAEVYVKCMANGYGRSFGSMCRQVRNREYIRKKKYRKTYTKYENIQGKFPGDKVQIDIKVVPTECIKYMAYGEKYYQITAIDEYSRKRVLRIVKEKSTYETGLFLRDLSVEMGFKIHTIQTDNGAEFAHDPEKTDKENLFEAAIEELGYTHVKTRVYSPWQNGKVERSHREDEKIVYSGRTFKNEKDLVKKIKFHCTRYNNAAKQVLGFKSPNQIVSEYFSQECNICLDI